MLPISSPYEIAPQQIDAARKIGEKVLEMRRNGALSTAVLDKIRKYFRIKNIYHSNAIEGNKLNVGETRLVVEQGLTITGKPLKDQAEAKNLSHALDFLESLASNSEQAITEADIRQIHSLILKNINDDEAGKYRSVDVEISGSMFTPTAPTAISSEMGHFAQWLKKASIPNASYQLQDAIIVASIAHTWFVTIHPFIDGNGRAARLLMNLILMRYGFPIAIVTREDRLRYYDALETSQSSDLTAFVSLISECAEESLEEYKAAADEHRAMEEWAKSIANKFGEKERVTVANTYEVWKNAMELLKSLFKQTVDLLNENTEFAQIFFKDFGALEFEKYASLKNNNSAKKTWFFRVDFKSGSKAARYLFFFGSASIPMRTQAEVTLHVSREEPSGSFKYERLENLGTSNIPNLLEIGYSAQKEVFIVKSITGVTANKKADTICQNFISDVIAKHFSN